MCFDRWKMLKEHLSASQVYSFVRSPCHALKAEKQWLISTYIEYVSKKKITLSDCNMKILLGNSKRFCHFFYFRLMVYVLVLFGGPFFHPTPQQQQLTHSTALCFFCLDDLAKFSHIWQILQYQIQIITYWQFSKLIFSLN